MVQVGTFTEPQKVAVAVLDDAITTMEQAGLPPQDIAYLFMKLTSDRFASAGLKLYIGPIVK